MSSMTYPEWWTRSLADAQEQVSAGRSTFGEAVDFLVADLLTSGEFLSFLLTGTAARMAAGDALDQAIYAVAEEAAGQLQVSPPDRTAGRPGRAARPANVVRPGRGRGWRTTPGVSW
jgi:hypothetical protein